MNFRLLFLGFLFTACAKAPKKVPYLPITVQQENRRSTPGKDFEIITLKRDEFSLLFDSQLYDEQKKLYHAANIVVTTNEQTLAGIKVGLKTVDSPYLEPGSGLAGGELGYDAVSIDAVGEHYVYYANAKDHRAELRQINPDGTRRLEWKISKVMENEQEILLRDSKLNTLYFAVFIDKNLNEEIEAGELAKLAISFTE
jgi:hypothetical protein